MFNGIKWSDCIPLSRLAAIIATLLLKAGVTGGGVERAARGQRSPKGNFWMQTVSLKTSEQGAERCDVSRTLRIGLKVQFGDKEVK